MAGSWSAATVVDAAPDEPFLGLEVGHEEVGHQCEAGLPPGHPPIGNRLVLPPGHPPVGNFPRLPAGHPPIPATPLLAFQLQQPQIITI